MTPCLRRYVLGGSDSFVCVPRISCYDDGSRVQLFYNLWRRFLRRTVSCVRFVHLLICRRFSASIRPSVLTPFSAFTWPDGLAPCVNNCYIIHDAVRCVHLLYHL